MDHRSRWRIAGQRWVALALIVASAWALMPGIADAYSHSGSASKRAYGEFYWCELEFCEWWYSYADGLTTWNAVFTHSEGSTEYDVAPFQQDAWLEHGRDVLADGLYPHAARSATIYNSSGTPIISSFQSPTSHVCYAGAWPGDYLVWSGCSVNGFVIVTSHYPPGSETSYVQIYDSFASFGWTFHYAHNLT